jgi:hypothetical protein
MDFYRVDMATSRFGEISGWALTKFQELMPKCQAKGINVLPVLITKEYQTAGYTNDDAYYVGYILGNGFAVRYGSYFDYYALGNEEEGFALRTANNDGVNFYEGSDFDRDYDSTKFRKLVYFLNGLIEGVKAADPTAKTIINCGGWKHYGLYQGLQRYGVQYDIIGYHWYDDNLDAFRQVLNVLPSFNKDVWFTEFNRRLGSWDGNWNTVQTTGYTNQKLFLQQYLTELESKSFVKAIFIYELFDEPTNHSTDPQDEAHYGIAFWSTMYTQYVKKPAVRTLKFKIEESKSGYADYAYSLYLYCNERNPDPSGLDFWTNLFKQNKDRLSLINAFLPEESYGVFARHQISVLLERTITEAEWTYWINRMKSGTSMENIIAELCNSTEFWNLSGGTNDGFIERLYNKLLQRPSDPSGKQYWVNRLNTGSTKYLVTFEWVSGSEYQQLFVKAQMNKLLRRNNVIDQAEINTYTSQMQSGLSQINLIKTLLLSEEYWVKGIEEGYKRKYPLYPLD